MKLKLKETPREWVKFTAVMAVFPAVFAYLLFRRGHFGPKGLLIAWGALLLALGLCCLRPRVCRSFYRVGMTVSFYVGQIVGSILLLLLFLFVLTPLSLILRLLGKDLLEMKRRSAGTYWQTARPWGPLDRMF
jgi:hypothetical protein